MPQIEAPFGERMGKRIGGAIGKGLDWVWRHTFGYPKIRRKRKIKPYFEAAKGMHSADAWDFLKESGITEEEIDEGTPEV